MLAVEDGLQVRRSLTIKQMAAVSGVAMVTICIFIAIQLFHFVEQRRDDYAQQLENIAHSVARPLSQSVLNADLNETQHILNTLRPVGILNRADVVLPNQIQTLRTHFPEGRPVPEWMMKVFDLPIKVSIPLYTPAVSPPRAEPVAYLVLQADPYRMYQFIVSALSTMLTTYLLLALILSISISWCINRLIIHPLRAIARELDALPESEVHYHQLAARPRHEDDELGALIRSYNRNQQLLDKALKAMQSAPESFPNEAQFVSRPEQRMLRENDVIHAMEQNDFSLFIQPQINMQTGELVGAEAFLRRKMADGLYGLEDDFIVMAEEIGVMEQLGYRMLELGCRILADWRSREISLPLSVSCSGIQIQQLNFLPQLRSLLSRYQIDNKQLVLEITETARIEDWESAMLVLSELHTLGIATQLDDFGLGYSGLGYLNRLRNLQVDAIKIDRIFVASLPEDDVMANIVASIAKAMSIRLIAEGVEAVPQRDWLLSNGIIFGQGFLFSAPLPVNEFETKFISK